MQEEEALVRKTILLSAMVAAHIASPAAAGVVTSAAAQQELLKSDDPKLAANKKLVYDMYREVLQAGRADLVTKYFTESYIQHNPNVASGRDSLAGYIKESRPVREIESKIALPMINIIAEREYVTIMFERPMTDAEGKPYVTTWFDMFRIENGRIAEHWDPALKMKEMLSFDPNTTRPK